MCAMKSTMPFVDRGDIEKVKVCVDYLKSVRRLQAQTSLARLFQLTHPRYSIYIHKLSVGYRFDIMIQRRFSFGT